MASFYGKLESDATIRRTHAHSPKTVIEMAALEERRLLRRELSYAGDYP
jgi:hypothetical protein